MTSCCTPPPENAFCTPYGKQQIADGTEKFLELLPPSQAQLPEARKEAEWISDTAFKQSALLARYYDVILYGWFNNILVNSKLQKRGLCWHYQQDLYAALRHKHLKYFYLGLTVRDKGKGSSHSCVYVNAKGKGLASSLILDPWINCGHLQIISPNERDDKRWEEDIWSCQIVPYSFPAGHTYTHEYHIPQ